MLRADGIEHEPRADPPWQPEVSVIVPLPDHRGVALECVQSFVRDQTYPRGRFEMIVVSDGSDPALDDRVKALLGPQDQIVTHRTTNLYLLYHLGALEAKGKLIFITEPHCIAEPTCLEELAEFFDTHDYDGACCSSTGICVNAWARVERRYSDATFQVSSQPGHWRKVFWKGFAIHRDVYLEEGGLEPQFGRFSECVLGAKLHSRGRRLGYATRATVRHKYWTSPFRLFPFIRAFSRGECTYRAAAPAEYCERYFGYVEEWTHREAFRPALARVLCRAVLWSLVGEIARTRRWSLVQAQVTALFRFLPLALFGLHVTLLRYRWSMWMAMARCSLWRVSEERLYKACSDAFERIIRCTRLEFIAEHLAASIPEPPEATAYRLGEVQDEWLVGFHLVERWGGEAFRWSGPVALIRLGLSRAAYEVRIETRGLRQASVPLSLGVFFNRHKLRGASLEWYNDALTFRIDASMFGPGPEQHLILTCNPLRPWTFGIPDRRKLGLPIFSIAFAQTSA